MISDDLKARAAKNAEEARNETPRLVVGTERAAAAQYNKCDGCVKVARCSGFVSAGSECQQKSVIPTSNTKTNKKLARSVLDEIKESLGCVKI